MEYISEQLRFLGIIRYKKMFGEYGIYCNEVFFALVCNDMLFIKTMPSGKNHLKKKLQNNIMSKLDLSVHAYPGSKNLAHVPEEILEDNDELIRICKEVLKILA